MKYRASSEIISYLAQFVSDQKLPLIDAVLNQRTRYLTVAIENVYQPHNASAILRSGDCFGIQDIHVIEDQCTYRV
ncbi:MAG TPA: rRNA methyltransferase, partial [Coxiellaceae bacterium]|nr:rRNA methyltransferase [Coxiellaceae bacterium]